MKQTWVLSVIFFVCLLPVRTESEVGTAVVFLTIPHGARASAMGDAFVAVSDDATSVFHNPASIAMEYAPGLPNPEPWISKLHLPWPDDFCGKRSRWMPVFGLEDLYIRNYAFAQHIPRMGAIGISAKHLNVGEVTERDDQGNELGTFRVYDWSIGLSYGIRISEGMSVGLTYKRIESVLHPDDGVATTWALDFGWFYRPKEIALSPQLFLRGPSIGASLSNVGPGISYRESYSSDPLPKLMRLGMAQELFIPRFARFLMVAEINKIMINWQEDVWHEELRESRRAVGFEGEFRLPLELLVNLSGTDPGISVCARRGYYYDREASNVPEGSTYGYGIGFDIRLRENVSRLKLRLDYGQIEPPDDLGDDESEYYSFTVSL